MLNMTERVKDVKDALFTNRGAGTITLLTIRALGPYVSAGTIVEFYEHKPVGSVRTFLEGFILLKENGLAKQEHATKRYGLTRNGKKVATRLLEILEWQENDLKPNLEEILQNGF